MDKFRRRPPRAQIETQPTQQIETQPDPKTYFTIVRGQICSAAQNGDAIVEENIPLFWDFGMKKEMPHNFWRLGIQAINRI